MDALRDLLTEIPRGVWVALITGLVLALVASAARKPVLENAEGWTPLKPTFGLLLIALLGVPLALLMAGGTLVALIAGVQTHFAPQVPDPRLMLVIGPIASAMVGFGAGFTFVVRQRFNADGYEQAILGRRTFVPWSDAARIHRHWLLGPMLETHAKKRLLIPEHYRGVGQLIERAAASGVPVELS